MLKKAGIVAAAGAASLVALSPLAFAGEGDSYKAKDSFNKSETSASYNKAQSIDDADSAAQKNSAGLINLSNNNINVSPQSCGTALNGNSLVQGALGGLFAGAENESAVTSDNGVNCTNATDNGDEFTVSSEGGEDQGGGDEGGDHQGGGHK